MDRKDLRIFEVLLTECKSRFDESIHAIVEEAVRESRSPKGTDFPGLLESAAGNTEQETRLHIACAESNLLNDVLDALDRIQQGTYGVCENCGQAIDWARLEALPAARFCIRCQQHHEWTT